MKWSILSLLLLWSAAHGRCDTAYLHLNGVSHHTGTGTYQWFHPGVGFSCQYASNRRWAADAYFDSHGHPSAYGAHEWDVVQVGRFRAGVTAGLMHHRLALEKKGIAVFPFALPYAAVSFGKVTLNTYVSPPLTEHTGAVVAMQVRLLR